MTLAKIKLVLGLTAIALLAACGTPGVPLPPSLELARPVTDLRAVRKGDKVHLSWSPPSLTTEHKNIRRAGLTEVCRGVGTKLQECGTPVSKIPFQKPAAVKDKAQKLQVSYTDQLPPNLQSAYPTSNVVYAVSVLNSYGKTAGLSNQVQAPAAPTLRPPSDFEAQIMAEGVRLSWKAVAPPQEIPGLRYMYRVYRRESGANVDSVAGELPGTNESSPTLLDRGFEWEKTYDYRVTIVTLITQSSGIDQQVEGEDTVSVRVFAHDVFPPATPSGLQAVFSGPGQKPFIDLVWAPNTEPDLAGYNVYRHEQDGPAVKVNSELVKSPAFRDSEILGGHRYFYEVSAIDVRGNESQRSGEASEAVPSQ
jgi:hypothetical protein